MMCLQAHYRSELEFSWEGLQAALTRLKRMVGAWEKLIGSNATNEVEDDPTPYSALAHEIGFDEAISNDLNTPTALLEFEHLLVEKTIQPQDRFRLLLKLDKVLGLGLVDLSRADLRIRPKSATINEAEIEAALARRKHARAQKDFATSDAIRDELSAKGVEVMDGDPLGWEWKLQ